MRGLLLLAAVLVSTPGAVSVQEQAPNRREVTIIAGQDRFEPAQVEVSQDDLVRVTLRSETRARSFAIDAYRIIKRVAGGRTIVFEFRADQAGTFTFYCNLTTEPACRDMKGTLVVKAR